VGVSEDFCTEKWMGKQSGNPKAESPLAMDSREPSDERTVSGWTGAGLASVVLLVYASLPTKNYYWDGISFAQAIEHADGLKSPGVWGNLVHPNHLVYQVIGYLVWVAVRGFGFQGRALAVLQAINMVAGAACVWLMQRTLLRTTGSAYLGTTLSAMFAFSALFWRYATDADAYIPSVMFLVAAFYVLSTSAQPRPLLVGILHVGAMLVHQLAVLFFPAAALGIFMKGGWKNLWRYCVVAGIALPAYYAGFRLQGGDPSLPPFGRWLTNHSPDSSFSFNLPRNLAFTAVSYTRIFFGGTGRLLQFFGPFMLVTLILLGIVLVVLIVIVVRCRADLRLMNWHAGENGSLRPCFWVAVAWFAAYFVFLFFWLPQNTFYKLFSLPAILFMAAPLLAQYRGPRRNRLALFAAAMMLANLALYIFPYSRPDYNQSLKFAVGIRPLWSDRTVVYYRTFTVDDWFVRYFNPQTTWKAMDMGDGVAAFAASAGLDAASGHEVWVDMTAAEVLAAGGAAAHFEAVQEDNYPKHPIRFFRWAPH
jgi:hypothetical protein